MEKENYWSPYISGAGIGLMLLASFYIMGKGLGASSSFSILSAVAVSKIDPHYAAGLKYYSGYLGAADPFMDWIVFEVCGLFAGALAAALINGDFRPRLERPDGMSIPARLFFALTGGVLIGFASRLSRGCTSGVALTGGAQLAVSGWVFVVSMFISGLLFAAVFRRLWR